MVSAKLSICKHRWSDARIQKPFFDQQNPQVARLESMTLLDMFADPLDSWLDKYDSVTSWTTPAAKLIVSFTKRYWPLPRGNGNLYSTSLCLINLLSCLMSPAKLFKGNRWMDHFAIQSEGFDSQRRSQTTADLATIFIFQCIAIYCCHGNTVFGSNIHSSQSFSNTFLFTVMQQLLKDIEIKRPFGILFAAIKTEPKIWFVIFVPKSATLSKFRVYSFWGSDLLHD